MKNIFYIIIFTAFVSTNSFAQQTGSSVTNQPATYIPSAENATYQNNSMFYNKDNTIDMNSSQLVGNGQYITPGFSNPINSSPDGRVESNNERQYNIIITGYENFNLTKPTYNTESPKVQRVSGK